MISPMLTLADDVQSLQHPNFCFILYLVLAVLSFILFFLFSFFFFPLKNFFPVGHEGLDPFFLSTVYVHTPNQKKEKETKRSSLEN